MKILSFTLLVTLLLLSCAQNNDDIKDNPIAESSDPSNNPVTDASDNWDNKSQRIQISQDNGNVPPGENRYIKYDYYFEDLSNETLELISNIISTENNLFCINDGVTYQMKISDGSGTSTVYVSNNRNCGRENETQFVSIEDFQFLIDSL